jgi:CheY-like chemotaxis protein
MTAARYWHVQGRSRPSQAGFDNVGVAGDGRAGYEFATQLLPDVIVLDLMMAAPDGVDLLPKLRTVAPDSPGVVLSADDLAGVEELVLALGAHTFLRADQHRHTRVSAPRRSGERASTRFVTARSALTSLTWRRSLKAGVRAGSLRCAGRCRHEAYERRCRKGRGRHQKRHATTIGGPSPRGMRARW